MRQLLALAILCSCSALFSTANAQQTEQDKAATEQQLAAIKAAIAERQQAIDAREATLSTAEQALRKLELETAHAAAALAKTQRQYKAISDKIDQLAQQQQKLLKQQKQQAELLKKQVSSAYQNGSSDFLKMLLNQQDPADIERMLGYYRYLNDARMEKLAAIKKTQQQLSSVAEQLAQQQQALNRVADQQQQQQQQLKQKQNQQEQRLAQLQAQQKSDKQQLQELQQNQQQLEQVLAAIVAALKNDVQLTGLKRQRGRLPHPTDGRIQKLFGKSRQGPVDWKGIVIAGENGQPVTSIADGRVLYADWLRGFGLVIVVDHGEGYMSLYGHNQAILKAPGEMVHQGETIALMGQSGGRNSPALYFEIRYRGNAVNPSSWLR
ncbi:peptidase M23 [Idiomarina tyrosinivorans]|uniref:Peptidase M23 n=1 Tax=Idiomarina tyrosinivorans TaxID=1445662 RepID=A0A432ZTA2_9GAMM|nr:peptidoglycan DD-metalloendopeptidase family protein [Idiomarina tyrosinivorans]RUO81129.1 peptidase M23 [Idiomarina tyrosinivorans]